MSLSRLLLIILIGLDAFAAWQRHVMTAKGDRFDFPDPHPLAYFTDLPMLREETGDFCYLCSPEKRLAEAHKHSVPWELHRVGTIGDFEIFDLYYRFYCRGCVDTKSILVKIAPDSYREIYHCEPSDVEACAEPSFLLTVDDRVLLGTRYTDGGNRGMYVDDYFMFDKSGATRIDFSGIWPAARALLPEGKKICAENVWENGEKALTLGRYKFWVKNPGSIFCGDGGTITVKFKLDRERVRIVGTVLDPEGKPE